MVEKNYLRPDLGGKAKKTRHSLPILFHHSGVNVETYAHFSNGGNCPLGFLKRTRDLSNLLVNQFIISIKTNATLTTPILLSPLAQ